MEFIDISHIIELLGEEDVQKGFSIRSLHGFERLAIINIDLALLIKIEDHVCSIVKLVDLLPSSTERLKIRGDASIFEVDYQRMFSDLERYKKVQLPLLKMLQFEVVHEGLPGILVLDETVTAICMRTEIILKVEYTARW